MIIRASFTGVRPPESHRGPLGFSSAVILLIILVSFSLNMCFVSDVCWNNWSLAMSRGAGPGDHAHMAGGACVPSSWLGHWVTYTCGAPVGGGRGWDPGQVLVVMMAAAVGDPGRGKGSGTRWVTSWPFPARKLSLQHLHKY